MNYLQKPGIFFSQLNSGGMGDHHRHHESEETLHAVHENKSKAERKPLRVDWYTEPSTVKSGKAVKIVFRIKDKNEQPISKFNIVHEKEMHLLAISKDLSVFQHLHPTYLGEGKFEIETTFSKGGDYQLIADYFPTGGAAEIAKHTITVQGNSEPVVVTPDQKLKKVVKGKEVTLDFDELKIQKHLTIAFTLKDQETGAPITDLQPYLGAAGHVVIVSDDLKEFLHSHPQDESAKGPVVEYMTSFPKEGLYKIWAQFKHQGEVITIPYTIKVTS